MNLSEKFYNHLKLNDIKEFTTLEARRFYQENRRGTGRIYYDYIYYLILKPLLDKGLIRRAYTGNYIVVPPTTTTNPKPPPTTPTLNQTRQMRPYRMQQLLEGESEEDREFFEYLRSKCREKGGV